VRVAARQAVGALLVLAVPGLAAAAPATRPDVGRHVAELCVATSAAPPICGPAQADVRSDGSLRLRVDDMVYRLHLHSSQVDVVLMHGSMQIDDFTVPYEWVGDVLQFSERNSRYEIRFPERKSVGR
jgi:proteasome assembly chaperone (PAC2) family protein